MRSKILSFTTKLKKDIFDNNRLRVACDYYKFSTKTLIEELDKIKIEQDRLVALNCSNSSIDRYNYDLLLNINEFNLCSRQQISETYCYISQLKLEFGFESNRYIRYKQVYSTSYDNFRYRNMFEFKNNFSD